MAASVWQTSVWLASCQVNLIFCSSALKVYSSTSEHSIGRERESDNGFGRDRRGCRFGSKQERQENQILLLSTDRMNRSIFHISLNTTQRRLEKSDRSHLCRKFRFVLLLLFSSHIRMAPSDGGEERRRSALTRTLITEEDQQAIATDNLAKISRHTKARATIPSLSLNWGSQLAVGSENQFGFG